MRNKLKNMVEIGMSLNHLKSNLFTWCRENCNNRNQFKRWICESSY